MYESKDGQGVLHMPWSVVDLVVLPLDVELMKRRLRRRRSPPLPPGLPKGSGGAILMR
jgi:hypothetical protein